MNWTEAHKQITIGLAQRGFIRDPACRHAHAWKGQIEVGGQTLNINVEITDFRFSKAPKIRFTNPDQLPERVLPHLNPWDYSVCYINMRKIILDPYRPAAVVLGCLDRATEVMNNAVAGKLDDDFEDEFPMYWMGDHLLTELPDGYSGKAYIHFGALQPDRKQIGTLSVASKPPTHITQANKRVCKDSVATFECPVVSIEQRLTVNPNGTWPPERLSHILEWLAETLPDVKGMLPALMQGNNPNVRFIALSAANSIIVIAVKIPKEFKTKEFSVNRRQNLPRHLMTYAQNVIVDRYAGLAVNHEYLYQRNVGAMKNLKDLKILQIGCGTIGGYLAQFLVQSGAGSGTGKLHLVDKDILSPANLGRHLLGYEWLTKYKAEACQEFLTQQHPQSKITYDCCNASKLFPRISQYDLVVNATGYDPFSYALNDHCLEMREGAPPVLHSWLAGNGVAAQSFFKEADFQTCYRCISTEVSGNQPRFPVLKDDVVEIEEGIMACGDGAYTPFPVSRSATAAAQALDAVLDWVNGNPSPRFRTQVLDSDKAFDVKNSNPEPLKACPACQTI